MKNMLVLLNNMNISDHILKVGFNIANKLNARVFVCYLYVENNNTENDKILDIQRKKWGITISIIKCNFNEETITGLSTFISNNNVDLIILGPELFLSNENERYSLFQEQMLKFIDRPTIIVSKKNRYFTVENIGVLVSKFNGKAYPHIQMIKNFADNFNAKLHLFSVMNNQDDNNYETINNLQKIAEKYQLSSYSINTVYNNDIGDGLLYFARKKNLDLAAVTTGENNILSTSNIIKNVIEEINCSLYIH